MPKASRHDFFIKETRRERLAFANRVLGAGVEPAHLAALEPKSSVSAFSDPMF